MTTTTKRSGFGNAMRSVNFGILERLASQLHASGNYCTSGNNIFQRKVGFVCCPIAAGKNRTRSASGKTGGTLSSKLPRIESRKENVASFSDTSRFEKRLHFGRVAVAPAIVLILFPDCRSQSGVHVTFGKPVLRRGAHSRSSRGSGGRDRFPIHLVLAQVGSAIISETENAFRTFRSVR